MIGSARGPRIRPIPAGLIAAAVIAAVILVMGWINVNFAAPWARTHTVTAQVTDVDGIAVSSDVRIAGRLVGQVTAVTAKGDHADLTLHIDNAEWPLPADTTADIRLATLLGQKYLELVPGKDGVHHLADDGLIALAATRPVVDFDQLLDTFDAPTRQALTQLIRTVAGGVQGQEGTLQQLLPGLRDLSVHGQAPTATLAQHDADLNAILAGLGTVADQLDRSRNDLAGVIDNLNTVTASLGANPDVVRGFIDNTGALNRTGHQVLGGAGAGQLAAGLQQLAPVASQFDRLLTSLLPQTQAFQQGGITPAITLIHEIGDAISQSDRDGYFLRQNLLGVDCSGLLPTGACTVPTSLGAKGATPTLPPLPLLPLLPNLLNPHGGNGGLLPPLLGGLLGDWWPGTQGGASLATSDWGQP
ncbi:MAG TPA: MlaD family protein [Candidatus Dormibacteraeota bacterium]|nr:MlaD family protein [Candidatus Dormibacteraeota bacterium]